MRSRVRSFARAGLVFPVTDSGPVDGDAVVLLHGFPQTVSAFDQVVALLHGTGFRTLVPTQRGYAAGARPTTRRAYATAETTADVIALLDAARLERAHIVGHDWGAAPAWGVAAWHPDRAVSLTVLSTPHPAAMATALRSSLQGLRSSYMGIIQLPGLPELVVSRALPTLLARSGLPAAYVAEYSRAMAEPGALTGALSWYRGIPFSARPGVGKARVPTTYVWGRHDVALGREAAEGTRSWVDAPYTFLELDAGHWLPETRPADVAAAVVERAGTGSTGGT